MAKVKLVLTKGTIRTFNPGSIGSVSFNRLLQVEYVQEGDTLSIEQFQMPTIGEYDHREQRFVLIQHKDQTKHILFDEAPEGLKKDLVLFN